MKKTLTLVMVLMLVASSAWAYNDAKHVKQAPNGEGDLLIFPIYFTANGGWQTKVTVTNTSPVFSVVAKVVIHSHWYSEELLDFLLYLTPNDVWTGTLTNDGTNVYIQSTDDSVLTPSGQFASATNPMNYIISQATCLAGNNNYSVKDSRDFGYIEVQEAWYGNLALPFFNTVAQTGEKQTPPSVSKAYLQRVYASYASGSTSCAANTAVCVPTTTSGDRTINVLTGFYELQNSLIKGYSATDSAVVFADWDTSVALTTAVATGFVGNPSQNSVGEIEGALAKTNLAMPYVNNGGDFTAHILTFPTKYSWAGVTPVSGQTFCQLTNNAGGPFWRDPAVGSAAYPTITSITQEYRCLPYSNVIYDTSEATTTNVYSAQSFTNNLCEEVNILSSATCFGPSCQVTIYNEGWSRYTFPIGAPANAGPVNRYPTPFQTRWDALNTLPVSHSYYGLPVMPVTLLGKMDSKGTMAFVKSAYIDGHVYGEYLTGIDPNNASSGTNALSAGITAGGFYGRLPANYLGTNGGGGAWTGKLDSLYAAGPAGPLLSAAPSTYTAPSTWGVSPGAWPYAPYRWNAVPPYALTYVTGVAPFYNATAGVVPLACQSVPGVTNICTWLPEYQYSNEIPETGNETIYP